MPLFLYWIFLFEISEDYFIRGLHCFETWLFLQHMTNARFSSSFDKNSTFLSFTVMHMWRKTIGLNKNRGAFDGSQLKPWHGPALLTFSHYVRVKRLFFPPYIAFFFFFLWCRWDAYVDGWEVIAAWRAHARLVAGDLCVMAWKFPGKRELNTG